MYFTNPMQYPTNLKRNNKKQLVVCNIQTSFKLKIFKKQINSNSSIYFSNSMQSSTNSKRNNEHLCCNNQNGGESALYM